MDLNYSQGHGGWISGEIQGSASNPIAPSLQGVAQPWTITAQGRAMLGHAGAVLQPGPATSTQGQG